MIILFEENETQFNSLGLGVLKDAIEATVTEKLNDTFELEMSYPVDGENYHKLKVNRLIYCKPNPYDEAQPFRIYSITKPIKGVVTVDAVHISYDMNGIPVKAIKSENLPDLLDKIQNESIIPNEFIFATDIKSGKSYRTTEPYNMRALLMGSDDAIVQKYKAELKFDKFRVQLLEHRGYDRNASVTYGHNMTDLNHETTTETLYNGVFPYYHTEKTSTETSTEDKFKQVYVVGSNPFQENWLSYSKDGEPYHPLDDSPVQIASEGKYKDKVYCWNPIYLRYDEKIYNEQVTLIQGLLEPTWLSIDWSKFPKITCKANRKGYFKKASDTGWGDIRGVGDTIFEGSIVSSGIIENIILYFSEVIPSTGNKENTEVTEVVDVQLDEPIIWLQTPDAQAMKCNKILSLNLTSEFDEEPSKERLLAKAEEYINENKIGTVKHSTTVSFIDVSRTTDADKYKNFDRIELGDTVRVSYLDMGVDVSLRVISTAYDPINEQYTNIELGEKKETMSSESVQTGDDVSSLTNDAGYASVTTVHKLIAETVSANYIEAVNAKLSSAMIEQLKVEKIECAGIIEASQYKIDTLVATLMMADNATIRNTLTAGNIKVAGDIIINSGEIKIQDTDSNATKFLVDRKGNVIANSVEITGGTFNINDGMFEVTNEGAMFAQNAYVSGEIHAQAGQIGDCVIVDGVLSVPAENVSGTIQAGQVDVRGIINAGSAEIGTIVTNTVTADYIDALGIVAKKIKILDDNGDILFNADSDTKEVQMAGFDVDYNSISSGTKDSSGYVYISKGKQNITIAREYSASTYFVRNEEYDVGDYIAYVSNPTEHNSQCVSKLIFNKAYKSLSIFIRSYAEAQCDYTIVSTINAQSYPINWDDETAYDSTAHDHNTSQDTSLSAYKEVIYNDIHPGDYIYIVYSKDGSESEYDDMGYVLLLKEDAEPKNLLTLGRYFSVDYDGNLRARSGQIGDCSIINGKLMIPAANIQNIETIKLTADQIETGTLSAVSINIGSGNFKVDSDGMVETSSKAKYISVESDLIQTKNLIAEDSIKTKDLEADTISVKESIEIGNGGCKITPVGTPLTHEVRVKFDVTVDLFTSPSDANNPRITYTVKSMDLATGRTPTNVPEDIYIDVMQNFREVVRLGGGQYQYIPVKRNHLLLIAKGTNEASYVERIHVGDSLATANTLELVGSATYTPQSNIFSEELYAGGGININGEVDATIFYADVKDSTGTNKIRMPVVNRANNVAFAARTPQIIPYEISVNSSSWSSQIDLSSWGVSTILAMTASPKNGSASGTPTAARSPYMPYVYYNGSRFAIRNVTNTNTTYSCIIIAI